MDLSGGAEVVRARAYVREVLWRLGLRGESSCVESEEPLRLYLAIDGHLPGRTEDVALLWTEGLGWAAAIECGAELRIVERLEGARPAASVVARWVRRLLSDELVDDGELPLARRAERHQQHLTAIGPSWP